MEISIGLAGTKNDPFLSRLLYKVNHFLMISFMMAGEAEYIQLRVAYSRIVLLL
jgi:hypothetical protein